MPSVQIKDVPDETHAVLRRRAAAAHQSLQEYLLTRLIEDAARPTLDEVLDPGAIVCGYLPTTIQVQQLVLSLERGGYEHLETFEVLHRSWHVTARSVRPDHRMVAHTGFVTVARRVGNPTSGE